MLNKMTVSLNGPDDTVSVTLELSATELRAISQLAFKVNQKAHGFQPTVTIRAYDPGTDAD